MKRKILREQDISEFHAHLIREEKSTATVEKYLRDVRAFLAFTEKMSVTKETVMSYKESLISQGYAVRSINSMLASLNSLLNFLGCHCCEMGKVKTKPVGSNI